MGHENNAWNVVRLLTLQFLDGLLNWNQVRSEFDQMLLNHARSCGVAVYEKTRVDSIEFSPLDTARPVSATWSHTPPPRPLSPPASPIGARFSRFISRVPSPEPIAIDKGLECIKGSTAFSHIIDATGRAGLLSTRYLKNRRFNASLKNIAVWGYWRNVGKYGEGTNREGAPWFEALTGRSAFRLKGLFLHLT